MIVLSCLHVRETAPVISAALRVACTCKPAFPLPRETVEHIITCCWQRLDMQSHVQQSRRSCAAQSYSVFEVLHTSASYAPLGTSSHPKLKLDPATQRMVEVCALPCLPCMLPDVMQAHM